MILADTWNDYQVLDCGDGEKLERFGQYVLRRPDPQAIWPKSDMEWWSDAHYLRSATGGGAWQFHSQLPEQWQLRWTCPTQSGGAGKSGRAAQAGGQPGKSGGTAQSGPKSLSFVVRPTGFKHMGIFPEQAANWAWMMGKIAKRKAANAGGPIQILNLFGYTGAATAACAAAGASVVHVDAARGMVFWGKDNLAASGLANAPVRWMVDDCTAFVNREIRRGNRYHGIILDPPSYGRGQNGEVWKLEDNIAAFLELCRQVLADDPLFVVLNSYTTGLQPAVAANLLQLFFGDAGAVTSDELCLPVQSRGITLPCGVTARMNCND